MTWDNVPTDSCTDCTTCTSGQKCYVKCLDSYGFSSKTQGDYSLDAVTNQVGTSACPGTDDLDNWADLEMKVKWPASKDAPSCTPIECIIPNLPTDNPGKYIYTQDVSVGVFS